MPVCHFITATLPRDVACESLDALARRFGRQFKPLANAAVAAQLPAGSAYFLTTLAHCDCGTVLGSARRQAQQAPDWPAEEAKLLRRGWSQMKVARALEQRQEKEALKQEIDEHASRPRVEHLEDFIVAILQSGLTPELGLLLHFYVGKLDEAFTILRHEQVRPHATLAQVLPAVEEDVLYVFRARN